ncbi:MAG: transcription antitermination protein NusB [Flavobacteriales bacterium]|nr:transcription antitermination protein NusB [Flavobacteriales bacterium]
MLTRRHIRAKVMQAIYAYRQSDMDNTLTAEKNLMNGLEKIEELYTYQYALLLAVKDSMLSHIEARRSKRFATPEELNPNMKWVENPLFTLLEQNPKYIKQYKKYHPQWADRFEYVRLCVEQLEQSEQYKDYINSEDSSFSAHKRIVIYLFKNIIAPMDALADYYEDCNMDWVADLQVANSMLLKTLEDIKEDSTSQDIVTPALFKDDGDREFATLLLEKTLQYAPTWRPMIEEKAQNWDSERIALIDFILMEMAITEFVHFPSIPTKVTLNEYIEISKDYSTAKSSIFLNGILDRIQNALADSGQIIKTGRGLM